jgi:hypothetical protein
MDREYWTKELQAAERELAAAKEAHRAERCGA